MKYKLEVVFEQNVQNDYPIGEAEEFDSIGFFIQFNVEQAQKIVGYASYYKQVIDKLQNKNYLLMYDAKNNVCVVPIHNIDMSK
jgi:hypothetical protein